jgi:hypothetical protein
MASPEYEIDKQLAADMEARAVERLVEDLRPELQKQCDLYDGRINDAWQTIQDQMRHFDRKKSVMFSTLKEVEGEERARKVILSGLDEMVPGTYKAMMQIAKDNAVDDYPTPLTSPGNGNTIATGRNISIVGTAVAGPRGRLDASTPAFRVDGQGQSSATPTKATKTPVSHTVS